MRYLFLLLALCAGVAAQTPELAGVVVDTNGEPVRRAEVVLTPIRLDRPGEFQQSLGNFAQEDGKFEFYGVPAGSYKLAARKAGYLDGLYGATNPDSTGAPISVRSGQPLTGVQLLMTPQSVVSGRVETSDGGSAGMISVALLRVGYRNGHPSLVHAGNARTTRAGDFRIAKLRAGRYYLVAEPQQRGFDLASRPNAGTPTYYPGTNDFSDAEQIEVATGQVVEGVYLPMRQSASFTVRGSVHGAGPDAKGINVYLSPDTTVLGAVSNRGTTTTDETGAFEISNVLPGSYNLGAYLRGDNPLAGRVSLNVNSNVSGVVVELQPPFDIRGTVAAEEGLSLQQVFASLVRTSGESANGGRVQAGELHFQGVLADQYHLSFSQLPLGSYIKTASFGDVDVLAEPLRVDADTSGNLLRVEIGRASGQIVGFVQDADGLPQQAVLSLIPNPPQPLQGWRYFVTDALANGAFRFIGVPPGSYLLQAWESLEQDEHFNAGLTQIHAASGVGVEMGEGVTIQVNTARISIQP